MTAYQTTPAIGRIRMRGNLGSQDLMVHFNEQGKVQGVFDAQRYPSERETTFPAYVIGPNRLYVDGFVHGEEPMTLQLENGHILLSQFGRTMVLR